MRSVVVAIVAAMSVLAAAGPVEAKSNRFWVGGGIGLSFGTVDYIEVAPLVGYDATQKFSFGGGVLYRYRKDGRFEPTFSTNDYGANVFARYQIIRQVFVQGEYEYLNYEFIDFDTTDREEFHSVLAGPGFNQPLGNNASLFIIALYNFSYDSGDVHSPYDDVWRVRVGVSFSF